MTQNAPPAGWYPHPANPGQRRYWDGAAWTDRVEDKPPAMPVATWKVVAGVLATLFIPILGIFFVIGMWSRRRGAALLILGVMVLSFVVYVSQLR